MYRQTLVVADVLEDGLDITKLMALADNVELVDTVADFQQLVASVTEKKPHIVLVNVELPGLKVLNSVRILTELLTDIGYICVLWSSEPKIGFVRKAASYEDIHKSLRKAKEEYPELSTRLLEDFSRLRSGQVKINSFKGMSNALPLTRRELEVISLLAKGFGDKKIADTLIISEKTVRNHIRNIRQKLRVNSRTQVVLYAVQSGLVNLEDITFEVM